LQAQGLSAPPEGTQAGRFTVSQYLAQSVTFNSTGTFNLTFSAMVSAAAPNNSIGVEIDGSSMGGAQHVSVGAFRSYTVPINVTSTGSHLFWIFCGVASGQYCYIDNVRFTP